MGTRIGISGNQLGQLTPVKLYGTTFVGVVAMPASQEQAMEYARQAAVLFNHVRLHHIDHEAEKLGRGYEPLKWMLDALYAVGLSATVTLTSLYPGPFGDYDYFRKMCVTMEPSGDSLLARTNLAARLNRLAVAVGDHPALAAIEPVNEETNQTDQQMKAFAQWFGGLLVTNKLSALPIYRNAGIPESWAQDGQLIRDMGWLNWHGYGDDAREGDPLTKFYATLWVEQPWQWGFLATLGDSQPRGLTEVGSLWPNPFRMENELWLAVKAKVHGFDALVWYLDGSNENMMKATGVNGYAAPERYTGREPMRSAGQALAREIFLDESDVKTYATTGTTWEYHTDRVSVYAAGDPWGYRDVRVMVNMDKGSSQIESAHLRCSSGGFAHPYAFESKPKQADGKYHEITEVYGDTWLRSGGGPIVIENSNARLFAYEVDPITLKSTGIQLPMWNSKGNTWVIYPGSAILFDVVAAEA